MRTIKSLIGVAALAAGVATCAAQSNVYSLNVVGYYNITVDPGKYFMIANQLNTTNNTIGSILPSVADTSVIYKYIGGGYQANGFSFGVWDFPGWTLNPGETAMFLDPGAGQTLTFVGEVLQGNLTNPVGLALGDGIHNTCFVSSMVPQAGTPTDFQVPAEEGDTIYVYNNGYSADGFSFGVWGTGGGAGPTIGVGQGFGYLKGPGNVSSTWVRNFTVQ